MSLSTRLTIAIVALVVATASAVGFLTYRNISAIAIPRTLARADAHARALVQELANVVSTGRADVEGFSSVIGLEEIIALSRDPSLKQANGRTLDQWRERVARRFAAELTAKPKYFQYRIIGVAEGGREIVRTDRQSDGGVRIVPNEELQSKGDRLYFQRTIAQPPGAISISPIELNQESGSIAVPYTPVIRISTPLFSDGVPFGILFLNIDLRSTLTRIDQQTGQDKAIYVVNEQGDYLSHPQESREFGFEFGKRFRIQDDFPSLSTAIATGQNQPGVINDRNGKPFGVAFAAIRLAGGPQISVIEATPEANIAGVAIEAVRDSSLIGGGAAVFCATIIGFLLAQTLTRPLAQMTAAVANFAEDAPLVVPLTASGEIGVLARAFKKMDGEMREKSGAIRRDAAIFENIMASMAEAVMLVDVQGNAIYENKAAKTMLRPPEGIERPAWTQAFDVFYPDGITPVPPEQWPSRRGLRGEIVENFEVLFRSRGSERLRHVLSGARPIRDSLGKLTGVVVVFRDVTEAKQIELQLRQSQKLDAIGQLTGGIAHDFNNMLTVITGTIEILADGVADRPDLHAIAKLIDQAADRGAELTRHLLAFARKQPLEPNNIDVNVLVSETVTMLRPTLGKHIEIEARLSADVDFALIDPSQLATALLNLALNARDAMPGGGKLTLETSNVELDEAYEQANPGVRPGHYVMIAVSDSGSGIPARLLDKVYEPFFTTKPIGKGTGLGLSMVYGFVKQSNGHIKIYSEEGHGTAIKLYLPRGSAQIANASAPVSFARGSETVLVVEDDDMVRNFLVTQLHSLGYRTLVAANGKSALALVEDGAVFDLLFTDVIMPGGMNGRQLADEVAKRRPGLKILYTSGYTEDAIIHHGRLDAGVLLLAKPYRKADLARMLRIALGSPGIIQGSDAGQQYPAAGKSRRT